MKMDLKIEGDSVDWIQLSQYRFQWQVLVNNAWISKIPSKARNFMST
jgi:hypothetical protein